MNETKLAELRAAKSDFEKLQEHPGWKRLEVVLREQIAVRRNIVFSTQLDELRDIFGLVRSQAECAGILSALGMPEYVVADLQATIQSMLTAEREEKEDLNG